MGIRAKLILSTCIPLLIIYVLVLGWDYWKSRQQAVQQIEQLVAQRASADASQVNGRLMAVQSIADRMAYGLANGLNNDNARGLGPTTRPDLPDLGPPPDLGGQADAGRRPVPRREAPRGELRGELFRNFADRVFGRLSSEQLVEYPWINAVWYRFDPSAHTAGRRQQLGQVRRTSGEGPPAQMFVPSDASLSTWFDAPMHEGRPMWLEPDAVKDPTVGPACVFATPFYPNQDSTPAGVVCVSVPTSALRYIREDTPVQSQLRELLAGPVVTPLAPTSRPADQVIEPTPLARGGYLILDRAGRILSRPDGKEAGTELAIGPDDDALKSAINRTLKGQGAIVLAGGLGKALGETANDEQYVIAMAPLPTTGWVYVTASPASDLLGPVQDRLIKRGFFLAGSLVLLVAVVSLMLTRFCRPIEQMAGTVRQLADGDLDVAAIPVRAHDEVGQLAAGFNDMTGRLRHHVQELTKQSAEREKVEGELRIARQIQRDLLPRAFPPFPNRSQFDLHAVNIPARHVAGDFYDYFFVGEDLLTIVIADVSGKGVPSALMMAVTRTMVRDLSEIGLCPRQIVERVNRMLIDDTRPGLFVTMVLGQYEPATGRFTYVNAGHPPLVCFGGDGPAGTCCPPTGPLLGVDATGELGPFEQQTLTLAPGHGLLLYTDGVTEAHDETNILFGERRLLDATTALADRPTPELCEGVVSAVMGYQHQGMTDDLTLVCLRHNAG